MSAIFRDYDQAALDREYNNAAKVADVAARVQRWYGEGEAARRVMSCHLNLAYGDHPRQRLDIFPAAGPGAPVLAFVHGGYWHSREKELVHFLAPFHVAAGCTFVAIGYRLCPEIGIGAVVEDVRAALGWLHSEVGAYHGDANRIHVAGHSAGGHLAAMMCAAPAPAWLKGGCSISGLHDLEPVRLSYLNEVLKLDAATAQALSPVARAGSGAASAASGARAAPLILTVGGEEGPEYLRQRDDLAGALRAAGWPVSLVDNPGTNHFTVCETFSDPGHALSDAMLRQIAAPGF